MFPLSRCLLAGLGLAIAPLLTAMPTASLAPYHDHRRAALSLTFDDGLAEHWTIAAPALAERGWAATFFVITGTVDWAGARAAATQGHEIGSHSTENAKLVRASAPRTLVDGAEGKIQTARQAIEDQIGVAVPGYRCRSFAYPFGITSAESDDSNLPDLVAQYHDFSRTAGGDPAHNHADPAEWAYRWQGVWRYGRDHGPRPDLAFHWISRSLAVAGTTTPSVLANHLDVEAIGKGRWAVYLYHAPGEATAFQGHLDAIATRADALWIAPFGEVAGYLRQRAAATLSTTVATAEEWRGRLTLPEAWAYPTVPLTVTVNVPADWTSPQVFQGDELLSVRRDGDLLIFSAVPGARELRVLAAPAGAVAPVLRAAWQAGSGDLRIAYASVTGQRHHLEASPLVAGPWTALDPPASQDGNGAEQTFVIAPPASNQHFYRLRQEQP